MDWLPSLIVQWLELWPTFSYEAGSLAQIVPEVPMEVPSLLSKDYNDAWMCLLTLLSGSTDLANFALLKVYS